MKNFDYAHPRKLADLLEVLSTSPPATELLGGGTDLVGLMKRMIVCPDRVIYVGDVEEMHGIEQDPVTGELALGAANTLDDLAAHPLVQPLTAVREAIELLASPQLRAQSTLAGELAGRPRCWYFRNGHGLLAEEGKLVLQGDNRYHAILGNSGPAKFVSASRLSPALIALGARVRIAGPKSDTLQEIPLESLYQTPRREGQRENILKRGQVITHLVVPSPHHVVSSTYEVKHGVGPEPPLAAAAAALEMHGSVVAQAKVVLGQVAPVPWVAREAAEILRGQVLTAALAEEAARAALAGARPLSENAYKVQLARVATRRAILQAARQAQGAVYA